jgi:acyl-CoA hydrolase
MDHVDFISAIEMGEVAVVEAYVFDTGSTSIDVKVDVRAEDPREGTKRKTTSSFFTFVALDGNGKPTEVPDLRCESEAEEGLRTAAFDAKEKQREDA